MPHFLIKKENINENLIRVVDPEVVLHLVYSLRIKKGEEIKFIDEFDGNEDYIKVKKRDIKAIIEYSK